MTNQKETAPGWRELSVATDGTVSIDRQAVEDASADPFTAALSILAAAAKESGEETLVHSTDENSGTSSWFTVDEEGMMTVASAPDQSTKTGSHSAGIPDKKREQLDQALEDLDSLPPLKTPPTITQSIKPTGFQLPAAAERRRRPTAADFAASRPEPAQGPAEEGWQGAMNKLGFRVAAGKAELQRRDWRASIQRGLAGHRTISMLNIKGGASKTTDSYLLAATLGRIRGGNIVCVDNNENRGTLGDRSIPANHDHTSLDLLANIDRFVTPSNAHELQSYIRPQGENRFHVLASQNKASNKEVIDGPAFVQLHGVLQAFYHLMVVDTGNASTASTWQAAVELSDELVLVAMAKEDSVKTLAATVDTLIDQGMEDKLGRGVLLLTEPPLASKNRKAHLELLERTRAHFTGYVREVCVLPFDPALDDGGPIVYENLSKASKEAWLKATAAIMGGL